MDSTIYKHILTIGPEYRKDKGGIGAVITSHSKHMELFNFIPTYKSTNKPFLHIYSLIQICKVALYLFENKSIQIVHIHGASRGSFYRKYMVFFICKYLFRKKVIYHIHSGEFPVFYNESGKVIKSLIKSLIEKVDVVICLSKAWESYFFKNFHTKKLLMLPNIAEKTRLPNSLYVEKDKIQFLYLGMIREKKGVFDLLKVVKTLSESHEHNFRLVVGGDGDVEEFIDFIEQNKLESHVSFLGWVSGEEKRKALSESDIFILPSYFEGSPMSILEAMSYGMPIISTNVGGIPEVVRDELNGFLIEPGDRDALTERMTFFMENQKLIETFGKNSLEIVKNHYAEAVMPKLVATYKSLLSENIS